MESKAAELKQYARWYDRQEFSRYNLAQYSARYVKAYKELDPEAITGFEVPAGSGMTSTRFSPPTPSFRRTRHRR